MNVSKFLFRLLLGQRAPMVKGTLEVAGARRPVLIRRDTYGIPYIEAENDEDAWYGLGFCHGQDRAFQLESLLRVIRGTLAELVGPDGLAVDRFSRRIGFQRASEQQLAAVDEETRRWMEAYARGVNEGVRIGCSKRSHEFVLLGGQPTPYTAIDVLGILKLMSFNMAANWDSQLMRLKILVEDGPEALVALDPGYLEWHPVISPPKMPAGKALDRLAEDLARFEEMVGSGGASNNWALAASRTTTGRPLLANDPHLAPVLPPYWYLAHVRTPDWAVAGASFVGGPAFPAGHNGFAAWGLTNGMIDNTDLFIEEIGPDGCSVREGDQFIPCEVRHEVIRVKGQEAVEEDVLITPRGPIISPALDGEWDAISISATWLAPRPLKGLLYIHLARSFEEFRHCFEQWPALSQNMVYADALGDIGWQLMGEAPQRRGGWGLLPAAGWDKEAGWEEEPLPFEQMPFLTNPEAGFVATANAQPMREGDGPFLGVAWLDGYRQARIVEVLDSRHDWSLADTQALQMDQTSILWRELRDVVLAMPTEVNEARRGVDLLATWDGVVSADSPAAAVFECFVAEMTRRIVESKAPNAAAWGMGKSAVPLMAYSLISLRRLGHLSRLMREQPEGWFAQGWPQEMADALVQTVRTLEARHSDDVARWAWGRVRPLTLQHAVGGRAPLDKIFNLGPFPWGGDACTVAQAATDLSNPEANSFFVASLRMVVDAGNWDESRFILPSGQSGNPLSPHYDDQLSLWQRGEGVPIAWSRAKVDEVAQDVLRLTPK